MTRNQMLSFARRGTNIYDLHVYGRLCTEFDVKVKRLVRIAKGNKVLDMRVRGRI